MDGEGCVYPSSVQTIANQLDAKYPPNKTTHVAAWRAYEQDMGNTPSRDGGTPDPSGGTDCGHPAIGATDTAEVATPTDQYTTRHNPFVWFHSIIDNSALCDANVVPLGSLGANGTPSASGHLAQDLSSMKTTPRFGFITPNLCNDGHDGTCAGPNSVGTDTGGLVGADDFLKAWVPLITKSPAYKSGQLLLVITFDEADVGGDDDAQACCGEVSGPNTHAPGNAGDATDAQAPGGGQIGALLFNSKYIARGLDRQQGRLQPLFGPAQLRGPARADQGRHRRRGTPGLRRRQGLGPLRHRRVPGRNTRAARNPPPSVDPAQRLSVTLAVLHVLVGRDADHELVGAALEDLGRDARAPGHQAGSPCCSARPRWHPRWPRCSPPRGAG